MILIVAVIVSTLIALLRGGRLSKLGSLPFRNAWLALAAVALQYPLVFNLLGESAILGASLASLVMLASYALMIVVLWTNRQLAGIPLVGVGMLLNLLVMVLNGGWMPISPDALTRLGRMDRVTSFAGVAKVRGAKNVLLTPAETRLWWLSDIFVIPAPFPVPSAFSVGDILIAMGVFWLLQAALLGQNTGRPLEAERPASSVISK